VICLTESLFIGFLPLLKKSRLQLLAAIGYLVTCKIRSALLNFSVPPFPSLSLSLPPPFLLGGGRGPSLPGPENNPFPSLPSLSLSRAFRVFGYLTGCEDCELCVL
jgi:hypothetical protein